MHRIKVIAHRGASGTAPENTLSAIQKALDLSVDGIEIDVQQTKDGVPVALHDKTVNRTTNGKGAVNKMIFSELWKLDAGSWFHSDFKGEKIPSLDEVLALINGKCRLLIEIKHGENVYPEIHKNILSVIEKYSAKKWCVIQSFHAKILKKIHKIDPEIKQHHLVGCQMSFLPSSLNFSFRIGMAYKNKTAQNINPDFKYLTRRKVAKIRASRHRLYCWTVNKEEDMKRLIQMGVDGIITDYPEKLIRLLTAKKEE